MFLNRKRLEDQAAEKKQTVIAYKKFFSEHEGRAVLIDMINRYRVLDPLPVMDSEFERGRAEGKRDVVLHIMNAFYMDLSHVEKLIKGETL